MKILLTCVIVVILMRQGICRFTEATFKDNEHSLVNGYHHERLAEISETLTGFNAYKSFQEIPDTSNETSPMCLESLRTSLSPGGVNYEFDLRLEL